MKWNYFPLISDAILRHCFDHIVMNGKRSRATVSLFRLFSVHLSAQHRNHWKFSLILYNWYESEMWRELEVREIPGEIESKLCRSNWGKVLTVSLSGEIRLRGVLCCWCWVAAGRQWTIISILGRLHSQYRNRGTHTYHTDHTPSPYFILSTIATL